MHPSSEAWVECLITPVYHTWLHPSHLRYLRVASSISENLPVPLSVRVPFFFGLILSLPHSLGSIWYIIGLTVIFHKFSRAKVQQNKCRHKLLETAFLQSSIFVHLIENLICVWGFQSSESFYIWPKLKVVKHFNREPFRQSFLS